jgi:hypothetical protein
MLHCFAHEPRGRRREPAVARQLHDSSAAEPRNCEPMAARQIYRIIFVNQGKIYEIYARSIAQGALFGFIEVEQLVFGERTSVVVDPSEERLKSEFAGVKRTYIPMHAVIRIDEVDKQGISKISAVDGDNVTAFPMPVYTPGGSEKS